MLKRYYQTISFNILSKHILLLTLSSLIFGCTTTSEEQTKDLELNFTVGGALTSTFITISSGGTGGAVLLSSVAGSYVGHYLGKEYFIKTEDIESEEISNNVESYRKISLIFPSNITFEKDSFVINDEFTNIINDFSNQLKTYNFEYIEIIGHTDNTGNQEYNNSLSLKRANSIKDIFIKNNIESEKIFVKGMGESLPIDSNETEIGRQNNRRVEINVKINN